MEQVLDNELEKSKDLDDNWELDVKMCSLDGRAMADGELCEACQ